MKSVSTPSVVSKKLEENKLEHMQRFLHVLGAIIIIKKVKIIHIKIPALLSALILNMLCREIIHNVCIVCVAFAININEGPPAVVSRRYTFIVHATSILPK